MSHTIIAGVDEAGRAPLAGVLMTAAVILRKPIADATDSKKLTPKRRKELSEQIKQEALCFAYGRAEVEEIDALNIHHATLLAMKRAIEGLSCKPELVLVDGLYTPKIDIPCQAIIQGDLLINEISAASILAKVARDEEMEAMDLRYPGYEFAAHKGYPTPQTSGAIITIGTLSDSPKIVQLCWEAKVLNCGAVKPQQWSIF